MYTDFVVTEKWPQMLQRISYFTEHLNYCYYQTRQTKETAIKIGTRWEEKLLQLLCEICFRGCCQLYN